MSHSKSCVHAGVLAAGLAALAAPGVVAQDEAHQTEEFDRTPQSCLTLGRIDRTEVIDDQTILFYVGTRRIYRNYLPRPCPGMSPRDTFMYETRAGELCDVDAITLMERWGSGLMPGRTCRLGLFHPVTPEEVWEMKNGPHRSGIRVEPAAPRAETDAERPE